MAIFLWTRWRDHSKSQVLALPVFFSALWAGVYAFDTASSLNLLAPIIVAELFRCIFWAVALVLILRSLIVSKDLDGLATRWGYAVLFAASATGALLLIFTDLPVTVAIQVCICLTISIFILFMAEQIYRHTPQEIGVGLRYFCLAVAGMFAYDIIYLVRELIAEDRNQGLADARGYVNAMLALPVFYSIRERFNISMDNLLPRQIVFYTFSLIALSVLIMGIVAGDIFIREVGGEWSDVLRIVFAIALLMLLTTLFVSRSYRNKARVLVMKALFQYKYDYRREWLRFIGTLSRSVPEQTVPVTAVRAIAQIVNSSGGTVWVQQQGGDDYLPIGAWNCELPIDDAIDTSSSLVTFLADRHWIIDLDEAREYPAHYDNLEIDDAILDNEDWWLIVPMLLGDRLSGFITLLRPDDVPVLNFEDHDILKTAGRHVATHIEQAESDRRLSEAQQFGAYNRLTAFLMHDLNNLIAQQSLVVENAKHHRHNPDFIDDAIMTISHSVDRMRHLMEQLSSASRPAAKNRVQLGAAIENAVKRASTRKPMPKVLAIDAQLTVQADAERLSMVIGHLLRNAQEATDDSGTITISTQLQENTVEIIITDNGSGMTRDFVRDRLFRPFDSTKGSQGMGIGVYQAREYARSLGGQLSVQSEPGSGTEFRLQLPIV
jgi:putative PEP-CTERM system histidine kinase